MQAALVWFALGALAAHVATETDPGKRVMGRFIANRSGNPQAAGMLASAAQRSGLAKAVTGGK